MKTNNHMPESLVQDVAAQISKHKSSKCLIKATISILITIAAGAAILYGNMEAQSWGPMLLGCIAIIALIMTFVYFFGSKPDCRFNGSKLDCYEIFFNNPSVSAIRTAIRDKDQKTLLSAINTTDNGLRLNIAVSEDGQLRRMQFFKYEPFEYKPESEILEIDAETAEFIKNL